jgi:hypothetical protein
MSRFPFEEDSRHRFGEFHREWTGRYIFIGRSPCTDPWQPTPARVHRFAEPPIRRHPMTIRRPAGAPNPTFINQNLGGSPCKPSDR